MQLNLAHKNLLTLKNLYCEKNPSFISNPDIKWFNLKRGFDNFANKLLYMATKPNDVKSKKMHIQS